MWLIGGLRMAHRWRMGVPRSRVGGALVALQWNISGEGP